MSGLFVGARHAHHYRMYRPNYPPEVYKSIVDYCLKGSKGVNLAVDLGCGTGQSTFPLAPHFKQVRGLDPSSSQIDEAKTVQKDKDISNVHFEVGSAENLSRFGNRSVDLITCAQSYHWLDLDRFYPEARRVLTDGGVMVAYGYGNVQVNSEEGNELIQEFYKDTLGQYWDKRRRHIDNHLADVTPFPLADFTRLDTLQIIRNMPIDAFIGYLSSWSAYQTYMKTHPDSTVLKDLQNRLTKAYNTTQEEITVEVKWPVFMLFGRNRPN